MAIRNATPRDRLHKITSIEVSHFEYWDIAHIGSKFPTAASYLIQRLGKANTRRRQLFKYYQQHHGTIARYINRDLPLTSGDRIIERQGALNMSLTSYATSANHQRIRIAQPPNPDAAYNGTPFECPYCFQIISIRDRCAWRKHVYRDLQPYICTHKDCPRPEKQYSSLHDWYGHEIQVHRREWYLCPLCSCALAYSEVKKHLGGHLQEIALFTLPYLMDDGKDEG
ncbi:hypothetical protein BGX38DRAFT_1098108, partial [Terfezia claveryi]